MIRTQIYLEESASKTIRSIALETGKKQSEIIRDAVAEYLVKHKSNDPKSRLRHARGIWKNRDDLPLIDDLRNEWERNWD